MRSRPGRVAETGSGREVTRGGFVTGSATLAYPRFTASRRGDIFRLKSTIRSLTLIASTAMVLSWRRTQRATRKAEHNPMTGVDAAKA